MTVLIYLDHAATTPMRPRVWEAMAPYARESFGNSSGIHGVSRRAKNALEDARERAAEVIGAEPGEIVFTSGGTESDNLAVKGTMLNGSGRSGLVVGATEHEAVLESAHFMARLGRDLTVIPVDADGRPRFEAVSGAVGPDTALVSVMLVNNETGTIVDVASVAAAVGSVDSGVAIHTDAVQGFHTTKLDVSALGVDLLSLTAHKFGGPKGAGLLYVRAGTALEPVQHGGGQEMGRRSGTHDVAGAVGLVTAMEIAAAERDDFASEVGRLRDSFEEALVSGIPDIVVNTPGTGRSPNHLNVRIPGIRNETLLVRLDAAGVAASAGSACQSGAATVSHVLEAMGLSPAEARESIRFSLGWTTTGEELERACETVVGLVEELR